MANRDWRSVVRTVAPTVATALGGPLAGVATRALGERLLGKPDADEAEIEAAVLAASPADLAKIKEAELTFQSDMAALDVDMERIAAADRASARQRQIDTKDWMPAVIAAVAIVGFFGLLAMIALVDMPPASEAPLNIMLGVLGALVNQIASFYFGSSSDSRKKTVMMGEQIARNSE